MKSFVHYNAESIREATSLLKKYDGKAKVNAGGTDLLGAMRDKCIPEYPEAVINIKSIDGLDYIKKDKNGIKIGALTKLGDICKSAEVKKEYAVLAEAAYSVASPHIRNMATLGGNLAQDVRCWYYRYPRQIGGPIVCLRKGGKICNALAGDNRYHSLFGAAPLGDYPCAGHCPANTDIPSSMSRVRTGDVGGAARIVMDVNPLPAITGRVCPVFCESECNRGGLDEPVAINCVERTLGDYVLGHTGEFYAAPKTKSTKKVAVVGSGPAGLAAAFYLRKAGLGVTVFEKMKEAGGMLFYSIPPYRLPKDIVRAQVKALAGMGVEIRTGVELGKDLAAKDLEDFNAVFVAGGTWRSLTLGVAGVDAKGVHLALEYLKKVNSGEQVPLGKKVIVVGGGSVAMDAARTARRLGAEEVSVICLECREPGLKDSLLAQEAEVREAEEEGIVINPSLAVQKIIVKNGKAAGVETMKCTSVREPDGKFNPQYDMTCSTAPMQAESVILAIGQVLDPALSEAAKKLGDAIFTGGDMASGPSTVIEAIASGKKAAQAIASKLGVSLEAAETAKARESFVASQYSTIPRVVVRERPAEARVKSIDKEDRPSISMNEAETEAGRCFNCGCLAVGPSDVAIALVALDARIVTTKRNVSAEEFFSAGVNRSTLLEPDELIKEVQIPKPSAGVVQRYDKFTLRKPVDFAVVSVASLFTSKDGVCADARIVLGAVAPEPLRARKAEEIMKGRPFDEKTAQEAAAAALAEAKPLEMNEYRVEIAKTLVKRAICPA